MNLTTTRDYIPELGFPESVNDIPFNHYKKIDKVNQRMIELQRDYAAKLPIGSIPIPALPTATIPPSPSSRSTTKTPWSAGPGRRREKASAPCPSLSAPRWSPCGTPGSAVAMDRTKPWLKPGPRRPSLWVGAS